MPSEPPFDVEDELRALQREFARGLPARVDAIARCTREVRARRVGLEQATSLAHRLHGTAGTYGFDEVSVVAGQLEQLLRGAVDAIDWEALETHLARLTEEALRAENSARP